MTSRRGFDKLVGSMVLGAVVACQAETKHHKNTGDSDTSAATGADGGTSGTTGTGASGELQLPNDPSSPTALSNETLTVAGVSRSYVLAVPRAFDAGRSYPLVIVMHGDGDNGAAMEQTVAFESVSASDAIVAYPTGTYPGWNLYEPAETDTDVAFISQLVDVLANKWSADRARVFAFGMSSGAFMANQLACRRPTLFRAIVSHSGGSPSEPQGGATAGTWGSDYVKCPGQTSGPAVMVIHGTSDSVVNIGSASHTVGYWSAVNACSGTLSNASPSPCQQEDGCPSDRPVVYCAISGLGHSLWSDASTTAWGFFQKFE